MWPHPRLSVFELDSEVLRGNPAGDPHRRLVAVHVPPNYADEPARRFPVVYVLAGFTGTGIMLTEGGPLSPGLPERMDRLVGEGKARPAILVLPDGFNRYGGSQYLNSSATGRWEDHLVGEVVPEVDRRYRTLAAREHRAVAGKSSGGYGALVLAMRHPDLFGAVASHAGDMWFELAYKADIPRAVAGLAAFGGSVERFLEAFPTLEPKTHDHIAALNLIAMSAAYSPNPARPGLPFDLLCDPVTGEVDEAVFARWREHDPVHLAARHAAALRSLRLLYLDAGTRDEWHLHLGARIFSRRLDALGVPYVYEEFPDGHRNIQYRWDRSLPLLTDAIAG